MSNIWKILTWEVPSTNRTSPPIPIAGFRISFTDGVIPVDDAVRNPIVLLISYFDTNGQERPFLRDNISAAIIETKGIELGLEGETLAQFVNSTMNTIMVHAIGGASKEERYATISQLGQLYGHVLLPIEDQTGTIS